MDVALVLEKLSALRLEGLADGDELTATLLAAVCAEALRRDVAPRCLLDALWQALPSDEAWNDLRDDLAEVSEI